MTAEVRLGTTTFRFVGVTNNQRTANGPKRTSELCWTSVQLDTRLVSCWFYCDARGLSHFDACGRDQKGRPNHRHACRAAGRSDSQIRRRADRAVCSHAPRRSCNWCPLNLSAGGSPDYREAGRAFGIMMAVNTVEHLDRHPEKTSGLPLIDSILHQPGCCRCGCDEGHRKTKSRANQPAQSSYSGCACT